VTQELGIKIETKHDHERKKRNPNENETYFLADEEEIPVYIGICNELDLHEIQEIEESSSGTISKKATESKNASSVVRTGSSKTEESKLVKSSESGG